MVYLYSIFLFSFLKTKNRELQIRGYELEEFYRPTNGPRNSFISNWIGTFRKSYREQFVDMVRKRT